MKLKIALLTAAGVFSLASAAHAGDGWYGSIGAGIALPGDDLDLESAEVGSDSFATNNDLDDGLVLQGAIGKDLGAFRAELELAHRNLDSDGLNDNLGVGFGGFPGISGESSVQTLMLNGIRDFGDYQNDVVNVYPYVGLGIGIARVHTELNNLSTVTTPAASLAGSNQLVVGDTDNVLAAQALAGLAFGLADNLMLDLRAKYLATDRVKTGAYLNDLQPLQSLETEYDAAEITANLRWDFGPAAAAAAPAVAAVATEYKDCWDGSRVVVTVDCPPEIVESVEAPTDLSLTVYFDYDKSNLTSAAQSLITAKSAEAKEFDISSVSVQGNTDSAGSSAYNNALSARRGAVVRDALVANGIPADVISVSALGETNPAKATEDGVREPLNRRTDVTFGF